MIRLQSLKKKNLIIKKPNALIFVNDQNPQNKPNNSHIFNNTPNVLKFPLEELNKIVVFLCIEHFRLKKST